MAHRLWTWLFLILVLFLAGPGTALSTVLIIINSEVTESELDKGELERIYLGKKSRWDDKTTIVPAMLKGGGTHEEFVDQYLDRTMQRFVSYWRQMVFTGKGVPPKSFATEAELRNFVATTPGAVGYLSAGASLPGVRALTIR